MDPLELADELKQEAEKNGISIDDVTKVVLMGHQIFLLISRQVEATFAGTAKQKFLLKKFLMRSAYEGTLFIEREHYTEQEKE